MFRSDSLHGMNEADLALYDRLGLRAVYDLRGEVEVAERPDPMPSRHLPILTRPTDDDHAGHVRRDDGRGRRTSPEWNSTSGTSNTPPPGSGSFSPPWPSPTALPAVFHCHAGKDRTGLVAALLLEALGVEREAILDDYELTARYRLRAQQDQTFERLIKLGLAPEAAAGVLTAPRWAMATALEYLDREYGTIERYLTGPAAMSLPDLTRLSDQLLVS